MKVPRPGQGLLLGHQPAVQPGRGAALREAEEGCDAAERGAAGGHDGAAADLPADTADPPAAAAAGRAGRGRGRQPPLPLPRPRPRWCATPPCTALDKTGGLKLSLYKSFNIIISRPALNQVHL